MLIQQHFRHLQHLRFVGADCSWLHCSGCSIFGTLGVLTVRRPKYAIILIPIANMTIMIIDKAIPSESERATSGSQAG